MKKLRLFSVAGMLAFSANAQQMQHTTPAAAVIAPVENGQIFRDAPAVSAARPLINAKTTIATPFITDTFNTNSLTTGGWTTAGNTGADSWKWANAGSSFLAAIASTTRAGGWLTYDAHTIALAHANVQPQIGYVTSPAYNCVGHTYVGVRFQQYAERNSDTFFVIVSTDNFATSTRFNVYPNNALTVNTSTDNPTTTTINISSVAANQLTVKIRFYYIGAYTGTGTNGSGGTYGWSIDDFALVDLDPVDLSVSRSLVVTPLHNANAYTTFSAIPYQFVDSLIPITNLYNIGGTSQFNATVNANIYAGGSPVLAKSILFSNVPINSSDSLADYRTQVGAGYLPTGPAAITTVFSVNQPSDATASNNVDTVFQAITDSVWSVYRFTGANTVNLTGGYYLQRAAGGGNSAVAFYTGSLFEVGKGKSDTLTSVDIPFYPGSTIGAKVRAEIYKLDESTSPGTWNQKGTTVTHTIAVGEVPSSFGTIIWTKLLSNIGTAKNYAIFSEGEWAVVITGIGFKASDEVTIYNSRGPASELVGKFGLSDTSNGAGSSFGASATNLRSNASVPLMRLNFSNDAKTILSRVGVEKINTAYDLNAFPNPANNELTVSFKLPVAQNATIRLMNTMGQVIMTKTVNNVAVGQATRVSFNTAQIASGMYYYSIEANGERVTNRVVVAH